MKRERSSECELRSIPCPCCHEPRPVQMKAGQPYMCCLQCGIKVDITLPPGPAFVGPDPTPMPLMLQKWLEDQGGLCLAIALLKKGIVCENLPPSTCRLLVGAVMSNLYYIADRTLYKMIADLPARLLASGKLSEEEKELLTALQDKKLLVALLDNYVAPLPKGGNKRRPGRPGIPPAARMLRDCEIAFTFENYLRQVGRKGEACRLTASACAVSESVVKRATPRRPTPEAHKVYEEVQKIYELLVRDQEVVV